jgi:hypothetical protein
MPAGYEVSAANVYQNNLRKVFMQLKRRRENWRLLWIAKFAERQRTARGWIAVADLVDWCVHSTTTASLEAEAQAREVAYRRLSDSILKGEFERDGRSKILYLDTLEASDDASPRCRLTKEQFEIAFDATAAPPAPSLPITVLNCCWLPADLARHWVEEHGYRLPLYLAPVRAAPADGRARHAPEGSTPGPKGGKQSVKDFACQMALSILGDDDQRPAPGYGRLMALARLVNAELVRRGHQYQDDSVRRMIQPVSREWEAKHPGR